MTIKMNDGAELNTLICAITIPGDLYIEVTGLSIIEAFSIFSDSAKTALITCNRFPDQVENYENYTVITGAAVTAKGVAVALSKG